MANITVDDLIELARLNRGKELLTLNHQKPFTVDIEQTAKNTIMVFTPQSKPEKKARKATNQKRLQEVVDLYNKTGSLRPVDYNSTDSQCLSYILALLSLGI